MITLFYETPCLTFGNKTKTFLFFLKFFLPKNVSEDRLLKFRSAYIVYSKVTRTQPNLIPNIFTKRHSGEKVAVLITFLTWPLLQRRLRYNSDICQCVQITDDVYFWCSVMKRHLGYWFQTSDKFLLDRLHYHSKSMGRRQIASDFPQENIYSDSIF